jgi:beta-lactam-binding protein with PASTA domain
MPTQPTDPFDPWSPTGSRTPRERIADAAEAGSRVRAMTPDLIGLGVARARWFARLAGFSLAIASQVVDGPPGRVLAQYPAGGQRSRQGARIQIILSGPEVAVPDVRGEPEAAARERLREVGFVVGHRDEEPSDGVETGTVMRTSPHVGSLVPAGAIVDYIVASDRRAPREGPLHWDHFEPHPEAPFDQDLPRHRPRPRSGPERLGTAASVLEAGTAEQPIPNTGGC